MNGLEIFTGNGPEVKDKYEKWVKENEQNRIRVTKKVPHPVVLSNDKTMHILYVFYTEGD